MAKCKYRTLAKEMTDIIESINNCTNEIENTSKIVQFYFYGKKIPIDVPPASKKCFEKQVKAHALAMRRLSPSKELQEACRLYPCLGAILPMTICSSSQFTNKTLVTWWGIKTSLPRKMEVLANKNYWEILLYCPDSSEISYEIDWFEKENYVNTFTFQVQSAFEIIRRENNGKSKIRTNMYQHSLPLFKEVVRKWQNDPEGHDTIPKNPATIFAKPFAPTATDYIAHAYEKVRIILRKRTYRNYEHLMILWKNYLEELIFTDVDWNESEKKFFIKQWEDNFFESSQNNTKSDEGRWDQSMAIDRIKAGKILKYFIDSFLGDPIKRKKDGDVACLLWTLIWLSQNPDSENITISKVLNFDTANISKETPSIVFDNEEVEISEGLHRLLKILRGNATEKRPHKLFRNLTKDSLEASLKKVSRDLFKSDNASVSPTAFLSFPHPLVNERLSKKQRARLRKVDPGPIAGFHRREILKELRKSSNIPI